MGLLWCNVTLSDNLPKKLFGIKVSNNLPVKLFGIKINDDASKHVDISKGKISETRPDIISYFENNDIEIKGLIKNSKLDGYYIRTDKENKILIVSGYTTFKSMWSEDFQNKCLDSKIDFIKSLSSYYDFDLNRIQNNYYRYLSNKNRLWFYDSAELDYRKNLNKFTLQILCSYTNYDDKVRSRLFITLMDQDYYKNNTLSLWEKISQFDDTVIKSNLSGF